jgi:hypothetical protein
VERAFDTLPRMQAESEQYLPLKEVSSGSPNCVGGAAPFADNLIAGLRHCSAEYEGHLPHKKYALYRRCAGNDVSLEVLIQKRFCIGGYSKVEINAQKAANDIFRVVCSRFFYG